MKLTVALRVIGGFAIITLLLLVISLSSIFNTNTIGNSAERVNQVAVPALDAVATIKVELLEISTIKLQAYYDTNLASVQALQTRFEQARDTLNAAEVKLRGALAGEGYDAQLDENREAINNYNQQVEQLFGLQQRYLNLREEITSRVETIEFGLGDASFMMLDIMDNTEETQIELAAETLERELNALISLLYDMRAASDMDRANVIQSEIEIGINAMQTHINTLDTLAGDNTRELVNDALAMIRTNTAALTGPNSYPELVKSRLQVRADTLARSEQSEQTMNRVIALTDDLRIRVQTLASDAQTSVSSTISTTSWMNTLLTVISIALAIVIAYITVRRVTVPLNKVNDMLNVMAAGNLTRRVDYDKQDEFGLLADNTNQLTDNLRDLINGIANRATQLAAAAEQSSAVSEQTTRAIEDQRGQIEQVATATQEMNSTSSEMANGAAEALEQIQHSDDEATRVREISSKNKATIEALATEIKAASEVINQLYQNSTNIGSILDVIRGIADQTNLLALNAAIEAARAGEQGRGFAVVADEVRTLASRTQESTEEIHQMIESLQADAQRAVTVMNKGREQAEVCVGQSDEAAAALQSITDSVHQAADSSNHITTAALEQSRTAQDISERLEQIVAIAEQTAAGSQQTAKASNEVAKLSEELQDSIKSFTV